jgi:hypothetical protein
MPPLSGYEDAVGTGGAHLGNRRDDVNQMDEHRTDDGYGATRHAIGYVFADVAYCRARHLLRIDGNRRDVQPLVLRLLTRLSEARGRVFHAPSCSSAFGHASKPPMNHCPNSQHACARH